MRSAISTALVTAAVAITVQAGALLSTASPATAAPAAAQFQQRGTLRPAGGDRAVQQITTRLRTNADTLRRALSDNRGPQNRSRRWPEDEAQYAVDDVVTAADHLADHSARNQVIQLDLDDVMRRGSSLETVIMNGSPSPMVRNAWTSVQRDLTQLASAFGQNWDWRNPTYAPTSTGGSVYQQLSGTYELDAARSDDPRQVLNQAMRQGGKGRGRMRRDLSDRLTAPAVISIERNGNQVTLASSDAARTTFDASGRVLSERRGSQNATTRASVYGDRIEVTTNGAGVDDFTATFEPIDGGRSMRLTRQLRADDVDQTIVIKSVYRRTSDRPNWSVYNDSGRRGQNGPVGTSGRFGSALEDDMVLTATLDQPVALRSVRENDRVTLTVHNAPNAQLENAVLEGYVTSVPTDSSNGTGFGVAFNRIRSANGRTADFSGTVENVRGPNGEPISFNGERVDGDDQRDQAVERGAIGAAIGAIVGAIAGGGKGAAIGAVVGAGGGAATVMIGGQRATDLPRGTQFTVRTRGSADWDR